MKVEIVEVSDMLGLWTTILECDGDLRERLKGCGIDVDEVIDRQKRIRDAVLDLKTPFRTEL